jgi:hypothetical protein
MSLLEDRVSIGFHDHHVIMLLSYHSALRIRLLASWIPCLLLIDHTTLGFVNDDGDRCAAEKPRSSILILRYSRLVSHRACARKGPR